MRLILTSGTLGLAVALVASLGVHLAEAGLV
jgi:hypothetical protein